MSAIVTGDVPVGEPGRPPLDEPGRRGPRAGRRGPRAGRCFRRLKAASFVHSAVYLGLLIAAFAAGKPEPLTFVLGLAHGLLWIGMSAACIAAARARLVPLRLAVAVAVLGGVGPFFGTFEFAREDRRRRRRQDPAQARPAAKVAR